MVMTTLSEAFALAVAHHQGGRLPQAEAIYRQILSSDPRNAPALHMLGVLAHQSRRGDLAIEYLRSAIAIEPAEAVFHNSLGEALRESGRLDEARDCFRRALGLDGDLVVAHYNMALMHQSESNWTGAVAAWRSARADAGPGRGAQ